MSAECNRPRIRREIFEPNPPGIWAEIHYLDSETDYREYLPVPDCPAKNSSELIMTDDATTSIWNTMVAVFLVMFMAFLFIVLLIRIFDI
jgi:hypothetical protein